MRSRFRASALAALSALAVVCAIPAAEASGSAAVQRTPPAGGETGSRAPGQPAGCCAATGADVPKVGGDYGDQGYSALAQITPRNVRRHCGSAAPGAGRTRRSAGKRRGHERDYDAL
jgi:hypothetical protein